MTFGDGFLWGVATSAFQIEGSLDADGRGPSIWDAFAGRNGDTGAVACDHYRRWREDVELLGNVGVNAYRFSIAWPRVLPDGVGKPNRRGLDFYRRLAEGLRERDVVPLATLYHWDLPQALQARGGWTSRESPGWFAEYASLCFDELGGLVDDWVTVNEPWVVAFLGHALGIKAPGRRDWREALVVAHHQLVAHGLAVRCARAALPGARIGITLDVVPFEPASDAPADLAAARREDAARNRWFLDPLFRGRYPEELAAWYERRLGPLDFVTDGDLAIAAEPTDFLGVNYYTRACVRARPGEGVLETEQVARDGPVTAMGWHVAPEGLYDVLVSLRREYGDMPMLVTENGAAYEDRRDGGDVIEDPHRVEYLRRHVGEVARAIRDGVDVRGYFAWSLLDNFEWENGYEKRFGLVYVDYETQERIPKRSALWYRDLIRRGRSP
jgi:beta-glucosidase